MEINILIILALLATHFVGDFVLQSHKMAVNKSKSVKWLSFHCLVYGLTLFLCTMNIWVVVFNTLAHFGVDYVTSKKSSKLFAKKDYHNFFVIIGFDQFIHISILLGSYLIFR